MTYFKNLTDPLFNNFQTLLYAAVNDQALAWNIPAPKVAALLAQKTIFDPLYANIVNKNMRNHEDVQIYHEGREAYEKFIENFANEYIMNNSAITDAQKTTLGFTVKSDAHSPRPQITAPVFGGLDALPGSQVQFICRIASDNKRGSVPADADGVEVRYIVGTQPATVDDCTEKEISSRARFTLPVSPADAGKRIYVYFRWRNNSNIEKSGPWSDMLTTVVRS